jgi:hypothetical protein
MTANNEIRKGYQKILKLTLSLLFSVNISVKTASMEAEYHNCHQSYLAILSSAAYDIFPNMEKNH